MNKIYTALFLSAFIIICTAGLASAIDSPHVPANLIECNSCHTLHNSVGQSLTIAFNADLCMLCHNSTGGDASAKPFTGTDQATVGVTGNSHRWDGVMPASDDPSNAYGLRSVDSISNAAVKSRLERFGSCSTTGTYKAECELNSGIWTAEVVCSTCHNVHQQLSASWNPFVLPGDIGTTDSGNSNFQINDSTKSGTWSGGQWVGYIARMTSGTAANIGYGSAIASNTTTQLTLAATLPATIVTGDGYEILRMKGGDFGNAEDSSTTTTIDDTGKTWTPGEWVGYYVKMRSGDAQNIAQPRLISGNTGTQLTFAALPVDIALNDSYEIIGRHMLPMSNNTNQLCEDCHFYRKAGIQTDVRNWNGGIKKSHPVVKNLEAPDVTDPTQFVGAAPVEPNCLAEAAGCAQTGAPRYHLNGALDSNLTNNIIFDTNGKVGCQSCHGVHFTDSDSSTVDQP